MQSLDFQWQPPTSPGSSPRGPQALEALGPSVALLPEERHLRRRPVNQMDEELSKELEEEDNNAVRTLQRFLASSN